MNVNIPQMKSDLCGKLITDRLLQVEGVQAATIDTENHSVTVQYKSTVIGRKNIEFVIAGVGFDANEMPAQANARERLPEGCR